MQVQTARLGLAAVMVGALLGPPVALGGTFYITASGCWCDGSVRLDQWNEFGVFYSPGGPLECELARAAFRIQGVPDDPALMRSFEPYPGLSVTGDPFGEGVTVGNLVPLPGDTYLGFIRIYVSTPLAQQFWSIEAPQGIEGVTKPVAEFESAPGTWVPQWSNSILIGISTPCEFCGPLPGGRCPFAVEPSTWTAAKNLYR